MSVELKPGAIEDLEKMDGKIREEIFEKLEDFSKKQLDHPDIKMIKDHDGRWIWRLKCKEDHSDHRIFLDYEDNRFIVNKVAHRDDAYEN